MEWKEVKIGDLGQIITGKTPKTAIKKNWGGKIPFLSPSDDMSNKISPVTARTLTELGVAEVAKCLIPANSICVSCIGSDLGKVVKTDRELVTNQQINTIVPHSNVDSDFVYYLMCIVGKELNYISKTSTAVPIINKSTFSDWNIVIPEKVEDQRRIASILSSLDRKIELNNKINADLEEMAQAIFKNWFVDFEPFKDGKFVDSELGMIPEGWKVGSLGDFCNVFTGKKNTNQAIEKGLYPFFSCAPEPLASNDAIFNGKAIIIAGNGSYTGRTSFYNGGFDLYQRTYACTIREQDKENLMIFFYHMMKQFFEPTKMGGTRGSSIPYIVMGDITQQKFPYSEDWLIRFSNIANSMMDRKLRIDKENSRLSLLRDTLLPRLMSGELEVPE